MQQEIVCAKEKLAMLNIIRWDKYIMKLAILLVEDCRKINESKGYFCIIDTTFNCYIHIC